VGGGGESWLVGGCVVGSSVVRWGEVALSGVGAMWDECGSGVGRVRYGAVQWIEEGAE
jgi:hypothetical protein